MKLSLNWSSVALAALITFGAGRQALADKLDMQKFYFAPEASYVLPTEKEVNSTVFVGGRLGYQLDQNWAIEVESGWMRFGVDGDIDKDIDITTVPVLGNIRYGQKCDRETPGWYVFAGAGWAYNDIDQNDSQAELQDATLWQAGLGAEMSVSESAITFVDIRYLGNSSDIKQREEVPASVGNYADLNAVLFTAGVKF